jgi:catecholate siderophore receptor
VGLYHLGIDGRPLYNHPWFLGNGSTGTIRPTLAARNSYGLANDRLDTNADFATLTHVHRFDQDAQLKTQLRHGRYERDLRASMIAFAPGTTSANFSDATELRRNNKARYGESNLTQLTSDYSGNFDWGGRRHQLLAGVDIHRDGAKRNNNFGTSLPAAPGTRVGSPNDGALRADNGFSPALTRFNAQDIGVYAQDTLAITPTVKLIGGLRFDHFTASYVDIAGLETSARSENLWSPRVGLLYQPTALATYYASFGTSYNTSGDTYQYANITPANRQATARAANTPPEKSRNLEIGGKWELFERRALVGVAGFYSEKYNERNTDADSAATQELLSGKRHAAGMEFNLAGRIDPKWEVFFNHTWIPFAKIDESNLAPNAAGTGPQVEGDRPALTPRHSGSLWTTYRVFPKLRLGAGLNYRSPQNPEGNRAVQAAGFTTLDAMAEYTFNERWSAKLNVTNLTDKLYADALYRGFYTPGAPRRVEMTVKTLF